ncbi:MAG: glycosyl hydrolase, partial [Flavobacteriaceae bacterium]
QYFINAQLWAKENGIEMYYFSAFDEPWKVGAEGDVGAFWGLWDKDENIKFSL